MTVRPDFQAAPQLPYSLPHSAQTNASSLAGGNLRLSFLIYSLTLIADFQLDFTGRTQQPHQRGRTSLNGDGYSLDTLVQSETGTTHSLVAVAPNPTRVPV